MKTQQKEKARYFRQVEGMSVREIAERIDCAKSSVSNWVRDIQLSSAQEKRLADRNPMGRKLGNKGSESLARKSRSKRKKCQEEGREKARMSDNLFLSGCMLYWAEGSKKRNSVVFTNTDPYMMKMFCLFLENSFSVNKKDFTLTCRSHVLSNKTLEQCESYWLKTLNFPKSCLRKGSIESRVNKVKKVKCEYGICTVSVHRTDIAQNIFGAIKEIAGIDDENLWLN